jgi:hypothetical protein
MAMKKTEIIEINVKPAPPYKEYRLVTHPKAEQALAIFEDLFGYRPEIMFYYNPVGKKFRSWIIVESEEN